MNKVKEAYEKIWETPDKPFKADMREQEFNLFQENKVKKILDLGCGDGDNAVLLAMKDYEVTGMDISETGLKKAKQKAEENNVKIKLIQQSFYERFPFEDGSFDAIYCYQALGHGTREQALFALGEIYRVLKKGGILSLKIACDREYIKEGKDYRLIGKHKRQVKFIAENTYIPIEDDDPEKDVMHYIFTTETITEDLNELGFKILNHKKMGLHLMINSKKQ